MSDTENAVKAPEKTYREKVQAEIDAAAGHIYALEVVKVRVYADIVVAVNELAEALSAPAKPIVETAPEAAIGETTSPAEDNTGEDVKPLVPETAKTEPKSSWATPKK